MVCLQIELQGLDGNPSEVVKNLGIQYKAWIPQTMFDSITLIGCSNVPAALPPGIKRNDGLYESYKQRGMFTPEQVAEIES